MSTPSSSPQFVSTDVFLEHWQGHRRLTRRMIEAFPEKDFATFSIGGMRTFAQLVSEILGMPVSTLKGVATGEWVYNEGPKISTKAEALKLWDEATEQMNAIWPTIPAHRFQEVDKAFGQWEGPGHWIITYIVDNEIHHRGQAYVYFRALGVEPPAFYER